MRETYGIGSKQPLQGGQDGGAPALRVWRGSVTAPVTGAARWSPKRKESLAKSRHSKTWRREALPRHGPRGDPADLRPQASSGPGMRLRRPHSLRMYLGFRRSSPILPSSMSIALRTVSGLAPSGSLYGRRRLELPCGAISFDQAGRLGVDSISSRQPHRAGGRMDCFVEVDAGGARRTVGRSRRW